jgi:hypothetical protein
MNSENQKLYRERELRYVNTVRLQKADRVPTSFALNFFPARYTGIQKKDAFYNFPKWKDAFLQATLYVQPDRCGYHPVQPGLTMELMQIKTAVWPGHGVEPNGPYQFVEGEYMMADEYDLFLKDPADFIIRYVDPRCFGLLEPLTKLPTLATLPSMVPYSVVADEAFVNMLEKLVQASREASAWQKDSKQIFDEMNALGFPGKLPFSVGGVPFDQISDFLRGMRGTMLDMYRCPDKLLAACDIIMEQVLQRVADSPRSEEYSQCFIALHRGADGFMSLKQFEKFYWPYLKKMVEALVAVGQVPDIFFEGDYTQRLDYLQELPHGKVLARFDRSDMSQVAKKLGGKICISGGMPSSLLQTGTQEEVKKYAAWLIDTCARDGGYIMAPSSSLDEVNPENLRALASFTAEYGRFK